MDRVNIIHKFLALVIVALFSINQAMLTQIQQNMNKSLPELRIKNEVIKQGTGGDALVIVKLRGNQTVEGFISQIGEDSFTVTNPETQQKAKLAYNSVEQIEKNESAPIVEFAVRFVEMAKVFGCLMEEVFSASKEI